ncbi:MAG TPA: FAD-dependent oxidoreductase [Polyangiales bacterium]|jgi:NADPH-dependent 2,4-dienoyl-CoA reductase/sulfur reductase-like enzyme|nr:FAD-dependent oxidoreductase [Polyangiales bacterium]
MTERPSATERPRRVLIVGASLAGLRSAEALRKRGYDGALTLVGDEPHKPYDRPPLSKQVLSGEWEAEKVFFRQKEGYDALNAELVLGRRAKALDMHARRVMLDDGCALDYDALLIATGAAPRVLRGTEGLRGVFTLRTLDDALAIKQALAARPRVAVIGAGFIGLEVAASCRKLGLDVTVVEALPTPLSAVLGSAVGESVAAMHAAHGVTLRTGVTVTRLEGEAHVERVRLSDGNAFDAELVVVGIGVVPNTQWLEGSGVALSDGVLCDAACGTNVPGVYAAGDVSRAHNALFEESMRVEHWSNAIDQSQAFAAQLLGSDEVPAPPVPYFWSDQYDVKLQFAGRIRASDELHQVHGALNDRKYVVAYAREGKLRGVLVSNAPKALIRARKLLSERASLEVALGSLREVT